MAVQNSIGGGTFFLFPQLTGVSYPRIWGSNLATDSDTTDVGLTITGGLIGASIRVGTQITGLDSADHHIKLGIVGTTDLYCDASQGGAATTIDVNKKANSGIILELAASASLILTIDGGTDNTPSAGAVEVEVHYWELIDLPNV